MALMSRLREHLARLREELEPEAGFERRSWAPGDGAEPDDQADATFEAFDTGDGRDHGSARPFGEYDEGEDFPEPAWEARAPERASVRTSAAPRAADPSSGPVRRTRPAPATHPAPGRSRAGRLRARLRDPRTLRELFLLREIIDRPLALRPRRGPYQPF